MCIPNFVKHNASTMLTELGIIGISSNHNNSKRERRKINKMGNGKNSEPVIYFDG